MKLAKNSVLTVLFVSALAFNTYAGDLETPGIAPPPPPTSSGSVANTTDEVTGISGDETDTLLYEALAALLSVF
jgi:hypothetical protein